MLHYGLKQLVFIFTIKGRLFQKTETWENSQGGSLMWRLEIRFSTKTHTGLLGCTVSLVKLLIYLIIFH